MLESNVGVLFVKIGFMLRLDFGGVANINVEIILALNSYLHYRHRGNVIHLTKRYARHTDFLGNCVMREAGERQAEACLMQCRWR
jgi:hypothetical protein